jgi:hypothetical protein
VSAKTGALIVSKAHSRRSWPVTVAILAVAFASLEAAGLPLMLTMAGLLVAARAPVLADKTPKGREHGERFRSRQVASRNAISHSNHQRERR